MCVCWQWKMGLKKVQHSCHSKFWYHLPQKCSSLPQIITASLTYSMPHKCQNCTDKRRNNNHNLFLPHTKVIKLFFFNSLVHFTKFVPKIRSCDILNLFEYIKAKVSRQRGWHLVILCHSFGTFCNSTLTLYVKKTCQVQVMCVYSCGVQ